MAGTAPTGTLPDRVAVVSGQLAVVLGAIAVDALGLGTVSQVLVTFFLLAAFGAALDRMLN